MCVVVLWLLIVVRLFLLCLSCWGVVLVKWCLFACLKYLHFFFCRCCCCCCVLCVFSCGLCLVFVLLKKCVCVDVVVCFVCCASYVLLFACLVFVRLFV